MLPRLGLRALADHPGSRASSPRLSVPRAPWVQDTRSVCRPVSAAPRLPPGVGDTPGFLGVRACRPSSARPGASTALRFSDKLIWAWRPDVLPVLASHQTSHQQRALSLRGSAGIQRSAFCFLATESRALRPTPSPSVPILVSSQRPRAIWLLPAVPATGGRGGRSPLSHLPPQRPAHPLWPPGRGSRRSSSRVPSPSSCLQEFSVCELVSIPASSPKASSARSAASGVPRPSPQPIGARPHATPF